MALFPRLSRPRLPEADDAALARVPGERVLAFQRLGAGHLVATDLRVAAVDDGRLVGARPWHDVDSASWDREESLLRITWVDGSPAWSLSVEEPERDLMTTIRARVQSTLVTSRQAKVGARTVRVALRRDLASGALFCQPQFGQGLRADDPRVADALRRLEAEVREEAGLD